MRTPEEEADFELLCEMEDRISARARESGYASLTESERFVHAVWCMDADVLNGGFDQYFFNSGADCYPDAIRGLEAIGAVQTATILRHALAAFHQPGPSTDRDQRCKELAKLPENALSQLSLSTDEFFNRPENLERLLVTYARQHVLGPSPWRAG